MAEKKKTNQLDRFTCGIYDYDVQDRVLLKVLSGRVPKHLRGNEVKKMAMAYLSTQEPALYKKLFNEALEEMKISNGVITNTPTIIPTEVIKTQIMTETPAEEVQEEIIATVEEVKVEKVETEVKQDSIADIRDEVLINTSYE